MSYEVRTLSRYTLPLISGDSDDALALRTRTFIHWVNMSLNNESLKITNLDTDFESGVILIKLLEALASSKKMPGRYVTSV